MQDSWATDLPNETKYMQEVIAWTEDMQEVIAWTEDRQEVIAY